MGRLVDLIDELGLAWDLRRLGAYLCRPLSVAGAKDIVRHRLARREADFLTLVRHAVFGNPVSPYRDLLRHAGCEFGDLAGLVTREGLEPALCRLAEAGVYLTVDELKGRRPAVRGATRVHVDPGRLWNPALRGRILSQTSGSRGPRTLIPVTLDSIRDRAVNNLLALDCRGGADWRKAVWGLPGRALSSMVRLSSFGAPLERCFLLVDPSEPGLHPRYRWSIRVARTMSTLAGVGLPRPEHVPLAEPLPVARWLASTRTGGGTPHLFTFVSAGMRACRAAEEAGLDLRGAELTVTGEPITASRLAAIHATGARALPDYGSAECGGTIAYGCLSPRAPDDVHLFSDLHAVITVPTGSTASSPLPAGGVLVSSLRATAPLVLLNVSMGDVAHVESRACGCPLEALGWQTHLHGIRSFDKLTAFGVTLTSSDLIQVLEEVLPARLGGSPLDYQLIESDRPDGAPVLTLVVAPEVGATDSHVTETFLTAIGPGSGAERVVAAHLRSGGGWRIERRRPSATASGKTLLLYRDRGRRLP